MAILALASLKTEYGSFKVRYHQTENGNGVSLAKGNIKDGVPYLRIQSSCLFSESFHAIDCDCALQLQGSLKLINSKRKGALVYLFEEGRGAGLITKIKAIGAEKKLKIDTVDAFKTLGLPPDLRNYKTALEILEDLKISKQVKFITNNPQKKEALERNGFKVVEIIKLKLKINELVGKYLQIKKRKLGHKYIDFNFYVHGKKRQK